MRVLLDTQCWIWIGLQPDRFSPAARAIVDDRGSELLLSAASVWEIAIKYGMRKLPLPEPPARYIEARLRRTQTTTLAITHPHALQAGALPRHHGDPFDRLLIAQAQIEQIAVITADPQFKRYDVDVIDT